MAMKEDCSNKISVQEKEMKEARCGGWRGGKVRGGGEGGHPETRGSDGGVVRREEGKNLGEENGGREG